MANQLVLDRYLGTLLAGDRPACRAVIEETLQTGMTANNVYMDVIWPIMAEIDKLYRQDRINAAQEAFATRINRTIVDQLQNKLPRKVIKNKKVVVCSGANEQAEQGGQMITDLFESDGWEGRFLGGKVNNDDILAFVHSYGPDVLLLYGIAAIDAPQIRHLIDTVKSINACPEMKIMLSGGVFLGAFFMATDYVTSPSQSTAKLIFGAGVGALTVLIRLKGGYPEGVCYAILLMNPIVPALEGWLRPKRFAPQKGAQ